MDSDNVTVRLASLSPAKRALLELKLQQGRAGGGGNATISRRVNRDSAPLSFAQQRLWFLNQLEPESSAYNERSALRLDGPLDINALRGALNAITERHEVLRTTYGMTDGGESEQRIGAATDFDLPVIDISEVAETRRDGEVQRIATELRERPFDLSKDRPLRLALIRVSPCSHVLVEVQHHIASDGWSSGVFLRELSALYTSITQGQKSPLSEPPIQYADYALWQRQWLRGEVLEKQLGYWAKQLQNLPVLELPTDRPRSSLSSNRGAKRFFTLSNTLIDALRKLSNQEGTTLFMTLLAAFQILLNRYTGQDDVVVGSPIAGRTRPDTEGLIGFFVNMMVLRTKLSGNLTFRELLARVRETALQAYEHQDLPFEKLVEELNPGRNQSQTPLFQVAFAVQNVPRANFEIPGLTVTPVEFDSSTAKFDVFAAFIEREREVTLRIEYRTELFEATTIERMFDHFQRLLQGVVADPDREISDLPMLSAAERRQLLVEWNNTRRNYPKFRAIHELFEEQVEKNPDVAALIDEDRQVTYRELNRRANQLAHYLKQFGIGPDALVGICMERSVEMIVGLIAILKAGGAYVPLDPSYPKERLTFMLQDSGAPVLITQQAFGEVSSVHTAEIISLDTVWEKIARESDRNLAAATSSDSLAYVIYTSGSTGEPKGVAVSHRAVNRLVLNTDYAQLTSTEVVAQASNVSFDAATFEIWGALLNGARLVLIPKDSLLSPQSLSAAIERHGITTLFLTTALFNQMVEQIPDALGKLRYLLFGGEAADPQKVRGLLKNSSPRRLLHVYGPTETTTFASSYWVKSIAADATTVPIGRPIANTEIYILDAHLNPVPIGVAGEIHIGGDGLAQGYLNRPELTAEKFVTHAFDGISAKRLYKTGDLARYLPDGNIEFLGRMDNQVKVRGYRIELGEIEATLGQLPSIRESVVLAREDSPGDRRLVAYVVAARGSAPTMNELRSFLKQKLPEYMVPSAYVFLDSLPLTPNGKLDRKVLPAPDQSRTELDKPIIIPRDPLEIELTKVWRKILGKKSIGVTDNFFDLGGHSLLAVQLFVEIEKTMGRRLPLATIFQAPTIGQLAGILKREELSQSHFEIWSTYPSAVVPFRANGSKPPLFWFNWGPWDFRLSRYLDSDQPVYGLQHQSQDGHRALYTSIEAMAAHYIKEIRTVQTKGPYFLAGFCVGGMIVFEMARQLQKQGEQVALLVLLDPTNPRSGKSSSVHNGVLSISSHITWFGNKVYRHLREIAPLETRERLSYALVRVNNRFMGLREKINWMGRKVLLEAFNRPLPPSLRTRYIVSIYERAARAYVPQIYQGRAILFKTQGLYRRDQLGWDDHVADGLEIQELDTDHDNVFKEPYVQIFAARLKTHLAEAQRHVMGRPN